MRSARILYHMVRADFLERVRRYSFLVTLAFAVYIGYAAYSGQIVLKLGDYRGVLNSAWVGAMMALVTGTFLSLVGFYIVRDSVDRDRQTRVGRILASTPMSKWFYVLAKMLSNLGVLLAMVAVLVVCALAMQLLQGESAIYPWKVLGPFLITVVPIMAVTAAVAVFFETTPILRTGAGNVIYFFAWTFLIVSDVTKILPSFCGFTAYMNSMGAALRKVEPSWTKEFMLSVGGDRAATKTFLWTGMDWNSTILEGRLFWLGVAVVFCFTAAFFFDRFDPAREKRRKSRGEPQSAAENKVIAIQSPEQHLTPLRGDISSVRFGTLVIGEIKMLLKGRRWWWYLVAAGIALVGAFVPAPVGTWFYIISAIWPVLVWSQLGTRESLFNTGGIMFSSPRPLSRQLPASWMAGVAITALLMSTFALRAALTGNVAGLLSWFAGVLFIPSLAIALGTVSGKKKAFEAIYTVWWYVGPLHQIRQLDFLGTLPASSTPLLYLGVTVAMLSIAAVARRRVLAYA